MGALAPSLPSWIPEDDLLLKNAVEAGASLESLAKGAVRFSRRYTIRELQERWRSLLYDLDTAVEASAHMVEIELSVSNLLKSNKPCNSKGEELISGKRKMERVRSQYYSMRKRICNEPCNSIDLSFLMEPSFNICTGSEGVCQEQLKLHTGHPVGNCMLGGSISNHIGLPETGFDIVHHDFPLMVNVDAATADTRICHHYPLFDPDHDCVHGYENVSTVSGDKTLGNGGGAFEHNDMRKDIPQILEKSLAGFQNCSGVQKLRPAETSSVSNLLESDELETKPSNCGNVCSDFGGSQNFNSPVSDCSASFHQLGYSSAMPEMPIWGTTEHISTPDMPMESHLEVKDQIVRANLHVDDVDKMNTPGYAVVHTETSLTNRMSSDGLTNSTTITEGDFMDLSNSLLNLANEEALLFMDVDEKDNGDRPCLDGLNSILLSSPNDVHGDDVPNSGEPNASIALDACLVIPDKAYHGDLDGIGNPLDSTLSDGNNICDSEVNLATASSQNPSPEFLKGFICCMLNTEDPEIPCNDDVFSSTEVLRPVSSSVMQLKSKETTRPVSSTKGNVDIHRDSVPGLIPIIGGEEALAQSLLASQMRGPPSLSEMGSKHESHGHGVKTELPESDSIAIASRNVVNADKDPNLRTPLPVTPHSVSTIAMKEEITGLEAEKHGNFDKSAISFLENPVQGSDHTKNYNLNIIGGCKRDEDVSVAVQKNSIISHAEPGSGEIGVLEPAVNFSTSDQEEQFSESDDDVPYFSDIEAMILDMDLIPNDQESYFAQEVSRYQYEETKKSIIRLEQGAHSYMQRAIASHGAFALFYGRNLKHYIKKPEVLLGRATEDVNVDIDLQREGRANKISRRQGIIKMEEDGSFYLKNLGKCSILVNNKEVATGLRANLPSNCLIEIRGMRFMFEINLNAVRQYITNSSKKMGEEKSARFEWVPDEIS